MDFLYTTPSITVMWQAPRASKVSEIVIKIIKEDFDNTFKESIDCIRCFFHDFFYDHGGLIPSPY